MLTKANGNKPKGIQALRALRHRNFRYFWFGAIGQSAAQGMQVLTLAWLVLELTDSVAKLGITIFLQGAPMLIITIFGGVLADRFDRLKLLMGSQLLTIPILAILGVLVATHQAQVWHVYLASILIGAIQALMFPARNAIVRDLVERDDLMNAVVLNSALQNLAQVIGPSVSGLLIGWAGISVALYVNASFYLFSIVGLLMIRGVKTTQRTTKTTMARDTVEGLLYVKRAPAVFAIIAIGCVMGFFIHPASQLMPAFAKDELGLQAGGAGILLMLAGIGAAVGNLILAALGDLKSKNWIMLWGAVLYGAALFVFAFNHWYLSALALMFLIGMGRMVFVSLGTTIIQLTVEQSVMGRALSMWSIGVALMYVGALPLGFAGDLVGLRFAIAGGAVFYLAILLWLGFINPAIRRVKEEIFQPAQTPQPQSSGQRS